MFSCPVVHSSKFYRQLEASATASKGSEVSDNDIHALKSICGRLADKESTFRSTTSSNCTEHTSTISIVSYTEKCTL